MAVSAGRTFPQIRRAGRANANGGYFRQTRTRRFSLSPIKDSAVFVHEDAVGGGELAGERLVAIRTVASGGLALA